MALDSTMKRFCATALLGSMLSMSVVPMVAHAQAPVVDLDKLAARGEILAVADPLSAQLRERLDEAGQKGFDIGMGIAEGHTAYGPGKQAAGDALPADQQAGYFKAVEYSITRNANLDALHAGGRVAQGTPALKDARLAEDDPFYTLGFDIATGLLYNQQAGVGELAQTVGAGGVRATLSGATQRGFDASARLNGRNFVSKSSSSTAISTPPGNLEDSTADGTAGVDRVGSVPEVVGLIASDAEAALQKAGYKFTEVTVKGKPTRPPFDVVVGTVPPAGTTLVAGSNVRYQTVDAAIRNGTGFLDVKDVDYRVAFDLETGKYAEINDGGDIFMNRAKEICVLEQTRGGGKETCFDPRPLLEASDGARVVILKQKYRIFPESFNNLLTSRRYFVACTKALSGEITKTEITPYSYFKDDGSQPQNETITTVCVRTAAGHVSAVRFEPRSPNGNFPFEFALFPDYPTVKSQGRVRLDGVPSTTPSRSVCELAKVARDRNSPAAPGLTKQCLESGGTVPQP